MPNTSPDQTPTNGAEDKAAIINRVRQTIQDLRDLPTLPTIALEVRRLISDPKTNMAELVEVIEEDLALTGRILRIANSAYYGVPRKIDNLKMALVILGMTEISNLIMTITVFRLFPDRPGQRSLDLTSFWRRSAICAEITIGLFEQLKTPPPSGAYIAGLLHDLGMLLLDQHFHDLYVKCLESSESDKTTMLEAELKVIGVDHGHIGSWLTKRWNIPEEITLAIAQHHIRPAETNPYSLSVVVSWADKLSYMLDGHSPEEAAKLLAGDQDWHNWFPVKSASTTDVVSRLQARLDRSLTMIQLLH